MKISVVMTVYNASRFITESLHSLLQQTYRDFELVIINDGSTDSTVYLVEQFIEKYQISWIRLLDVPHMGRAKALNHGVAHADYDWIAIMDADDLWHRDKLRWQVYFMKKLGAKFLATQSKSFKRVYEINSSVPYDEYGFKINQIHLKEMLYANFIAHSSVLVAKNLLNYDEGRLSQIDYEMWLRLLLQGHPIFVLNQVMIFHRVHAHQSFEAKKWLRYALNATILQLKYCVKSLHLFPIFFIFLKLFYYIIFPRKVRILVHDLMIRLLLRIKPDRI